MSFINEDELHNRINNSGNLLRIPDETPEPSLVDIVSDAVDHGIVLNRVERDTGGPGRRPGDNNVPEVFRELIAVEKNITDQTCEDLGQKYGIMPGRVSAYSRGVVNEPAVLASRGAGPTKGDKALRKALDENLGKVRDVALTKIMACLENIDEDKLSERTAKELSQIALNLSGVVRTTMPKEDAATQINFQTLFYSPEAKPVDQFQVIDLP